MKVVAVPIKKISFMYSALAPAVKVSFPTSYGTAYVFLDDLYVDPAKAANKLKVAISAIVEQNLKELYRL